MNFAFYIALYCVLLYTQSALQSCGGRGGGAHLLYPMAFLLFTYIFCFPFYELVSLLHLIYIKCLLLIYLFIYLCASNLACCSWSQDAQ